MLVGTVIAYLFLECGLLIGKKVFKPGARRPLVS